MDENRREEGLGFSWGYLSGLGDPFRVFWNLLDSGWGTLGA